MWFAWLKTVGNYFRHALPVIMLLFLNHGFYGTLVSLSYCICAINDLYCLMAFEL